MCRGSEYAKVADGRMLTYCNVRTRINDREE